MTNLGGSAPSIFRWVWLSTLFAMLMLGSPARAQIPAPPVRQNVDGNGVDILHGSFSSSATDISIGSAAGHGLGYTRYWTGYGWRDSMVATVSGSGASPVVSIGGTSETFTRLTNGSSGWTYSADLANGAALFRESGGDYVYTGADGTIVRFMPNGGYTLGQYETQLARARSITSPDGTVLTFTYKTGSYTSGSQTVSLARIQSVTNNFGYQLKFTYAANTITSFDLVPVANWEYPSRVTTINNAVEYCAPAVDNCSLVNAWPHSDYTYALDDNFGTVNLTSVADPVGRIWRYSYYVGKLIGVRRPSSTSDDVVIENYGLNGQISKIQKMGQAWTYNYVLGGYNYTIETATVTDPLANTRVIVVDTLYVHVNSETDENNRTTTYGYDLSYGRLAQVTAPEGNYVSYGYDARGNLTSTVATPKVGSGLAALSTLASYPSTCVNSKTCNKPVTTTDAAGNVTNYYWNTDGSPNYVEQPAPTTGAARPRASYGYGTFSAWAKTSSGTFAVSPSPVTLPTKSWSCISTSACLDTSADAVRTTFAYQSGSSSSGSNLLALSTTTGAGTGSLAATVTLSYDNIGNAAYADGPLAGTADTVRTLYNNARQVVGVIGPDPDGAGALKNRAQRTTFDADGQPALVEQGTTLGQSDANWAAFATLQQAATSYDIYGRNIRDTISAGGTTYNVTQYSYDALGRLDCAAQRMDPAQWGSQPSVCTPQTTGPNGADRITKRIYDAASQVTIVQTALGTADAVNEATLAYTPNGKQSTLTDANGNVTGYAYDGFDRLSETHYPSPTTLGQTSPTDWVGLVYDANGNVFYQRLRDGSVIRYTYDALDRVTFKDVPNTAYRESDVTYSYDLLGRLSFVTDADGYYATLNHDALGRLTTDHNVFAGKWLEYDAAGRLTKLTWNGGLYVTYDYDTTGNVTAVRENGVISGPGVLATFAYDDLGRRASLTRGNGTATAYSYDPVSRLSSLAHDLAGSAQDVTTSFAYNPASQIASSTRSNDAYAWGGHYNVDRPYAVNGLNQLTTAGATALGYDGRGNLTSSGSSAYSYTSENRLATSPGTQLSYDPLGRLLWSTVGIRFDETADHITTEIDGSTNATLRRYVWVPGSDEPLVWYEGAGTTDRRWLVADERGSVVAVTDASGAALAINTYDEYGIPASTNLGRFGYTGQAWLPELGMSYYKARIYSPTLGRFLQTDPIGYGDGVNWYNYVKGDPANGTDPSGLTTGTNIPGGDFLCSSCSGTSTGIASGSGGGERGDDRRFPPGATSATVPYIDTSGVGRTYLWDLAFYHYGPSELSGATAGYGGAGASQNEGGGFQRVSMLKNPAAVLKVGPNASAHILARHVATSPGDQSKFSDKYSDPIHLLALIAYAAVHVVPPGPSSTYFNYTVSFPEMVGTEYGVPTNVYTVSVYNTGRTEYGLPVYSVNNMYPGR